MKIGIIDSGLDVRHKVFNKEKISGYGIYQKNDEYKITNDYHDEIGHGTGIAGIIHKSLPNEQLLIVKVFDKNLITHETVICKALQICIENNVDIINMSLGIETQNPSNDLISIINEAYKKNIIIISAANNSPNIECYPAYFSSVFGVISGNIKNKSEFGYIKNSPIEFIAKGTIQRVVWKNGDYNITGGTSYACPHFTVIVGNLRLNNSNLSISEIKQRLIDTSNEKYTPTHVLNNSEFAQMGIYNKDIEEVGNRLFNTKLECAKMNNILLFPISEKEINTLLEFSESGSLKKEILIDYPKMGNSKHTSKFNIINRIPNNEEIKSVDSFVLGYFHDHQFEANVKFGYELVELGIMYNKNFFVFDSRLEKKIKEIAKKFDYKGNIIIPKVDDFLFKDVMKLRFLPTLKTPVLAVIGTSNKQGKITTQLRLKEILEREGYKVALISTEPQGELLGACFSFPFGFNSTVEIKREDWSVFLRILLRAIQEFLKPDIILTGTQGCFIPRMARNNLWGSELDPLEYIHGVLPDAFVCVINPEDDIKLINSMVTTAVAFTKSKPLFYTLNPMERNYDRQEFNNTRILDDKEYDEKLSFFSQQLNSEVFNIMDTSKDEIFIKFIQDFYSIKNDYLEYLN